MSPEEIARKMIFEAVASFKARAMAAAMECDLTPEGDVERRTFAMQFKIADDVGKTIAAAIKR